MEMSQQNKIKWRKMAQEIIGIDGLARFDYLEEKLSEYPRIKYEDRPIADQKKLTEIINEIDSIHDSISEGI